jgi:predicted metal-dependent phosphoesterase TrpH
VSIDLHIHSTASDGTLTPAQIVTRASRLGLAAIALTDHDTVAGVSQILQRIPANIRFLSGVELSTAPPREFPCQGSLHLLGYGFRHDDPGLHRELRKLQSARRDRNPQIIARLQSLGIEISVDELETAGDARQTGRPHIARLLMEKGLVASFDEAFDRYIGNGRPAYMDKYRIDIDRAIALIRSAGGVAVLAHPALIAPRHPWQLEDLITALKARGLEGVEAYYPEHSEAQTRRLLDLARRHDMLATGGTDFHGTIKPGVELGCADGRFEVPYQVYQELAARLETRRPRS